MARPIIRRVAAQTSEIFLHALLKPRPHPSIAGVMKHLQSIALAIALLATGAVTPAEQTTAPPGWSGNVHQLAVKLTERSAPELLRPLFADRFSGQFLSGQPATLDQLAPILSNVDWIEQFSYRANPDSLASDVIAAVNKSNLPQEVRKYFIPAGNQPERAANLNAMKWIGQQLKARSDQPIGVILAHSPSIDAETQPHGTVVVILLAGELVGFEQYQIRQIAFGTFTPRN